jgi:hypothetical protein
MASIQMTEALSSALIVRFQAEYGQQSVSNFALDILLDSATAEIVRLQSANAALMERVRLAESQLEDMKQAADPKRAEVMGAADQVKQRRQVKNGTDTH